MPKGFRKSYFTLAAIQAFMSMLKIIAQFSCALTLSGKPLTLQINSPPSS
ncbi:MAG: hypothetical protein Q9M43_05045 [Sulfurimonas sp.]|nr:hypothetical protein [Sulfurimonas sp.]